MDILVCIKQVPDTSSQLKTSQDKKDIQREGLSYVINPYDEYAVEEALLIKERFGGKVTVISLGAERVTEALRTCLALGCDEAIHLKMAPSQYVDPLSTAKLIHSVISKMPYDLILCGKQAVDDDAAETGPALAGLLNLPQATVATKIELSDNLKTAKVYQETEGALRIIEARLPCVISCQKGLNVPRYATLTGIISAKKKGLKILELNGDRLQNTIEVLELIEPEERKQGRILQGTVAEQVMELVRRLKEEAGVL